MEYLEAGEFRVSDKIIRSLRNQIPWFLLYFALFVLVIIILAATETGREILAEYKFHQ